MFKLAQVHLIINSPVKLFKMNPESILRADMLDIVFENRNKQYGAYELRIHYERRLRNALAIMLSTVCFTCIAICIGTHFFHQANSIIKIFDDGIREVSIVKPLDPSSREIIRPKKQQLINKPVATVKSDLPRIVQDKFVDKSLPETTDISLKQIGTETKPGELAGSYEQVTANGNGNSGEIKNEAAEPTIYSTAEFMPEFPGGQAALQKFLSTNIRMAKDLEPGTKIKVLAKFVVDENGNISVMQTIQSGGAEFDHEVLRVLKKMPRWKPGKQNGRNVSVYFTLPVIFQASDDY
jgi:periplasmic protein TonB